MPAGIVASGKQFKVTRFNGGNQWVEIPTNATLDFAKATPFSLSCWVKCSFVSNIVAVMNKAILGPPPAGYVLAINPDGTFKFTLTNHDGSQVGKGSTASFNDGKWHHLVGTYSGNALETGIALYADGLAVATAAIGSALGAADFLNAAPFQLGMRQGIGGAPLDMYDAAVYNKALSAAEVTAIHNKHCPPDLTVVGPVANLRSFLSMGTHVGDTSLAPRAATYPYCLDASSSNNGGLMLNMSPASLVTRDQPRSAVRVNFASLFAPGSVMQAVQSDLGLTYGTQMLAATGNTATATMQLGGTLPAGVIPMAIKIQLMTASTVNVYLAGSATPSLTGVAAVPGVPILLTGAATGLFITPTAGTLVVNNSWVATCAGLADQSGNGFHMTQTAPSRQMEILGANGYPILKAQSSRASQLSSAMTRPPPSTQTTFVWVLYRPVSAPANAALIYGSNNLLGCVYIDASMQLAQHMGSAGNGSLPYSGQTKFARAEAWFNNATTDYVRWGSSKRVGPVSAGDSTQGVVWSLGAPSVFDPVTAADAEILAAVTAISRPSDAVLLALDDAAANMYPGILL